MITYNSLIFTLWVSLLPSLEYLICRYLQHTVMGVPVGWVWAVDYDFFLSVPIALCLVLSYLRQRDPYLKLKFLPINFFVHIGFLVLFFYILNADQIVVKSVPVIFTFLLVLLSGLTLFIPWQFYIKNPNRWILIPGVGIALSTAIGKNIYSYIWVSYANHLASVFTKIFQFFHQNQFITVWHPAKKLFQIIGPQFSLLIGSGCGGFDGFLFMSFSLLTFYFIRKKSLKLNFKLLGVFLLGIYWMYLINILRIVLLTAFKWELSKRVSIVLEEKLFYQIAHIHLGWILYVSAVAVFLYFIKLIENNKLSTGLYSRLFSTGHSEENESSLA